MLYWGLFTTGFIVGGIFASFIFSNKEENSREVLDNVSVKDKEMGYRGKPEEVFSKLTRVNFYTKTSR